VVGGGDRGTRTPDLPDVIGTLSLIMRENGKYFPVGLGGEFANLCLRTKG